LKHNVLNTFWKAVQPFEDAIILAQTANLFFPTFRAVQIDEAELLKQGK